MIVFVLYESELYVVFRSICLLKIILIFGKSHYNLRIYIKIINSRYIYIYIELIIFSSHYSVDFFVVSSILPPENIVYISIDRKWIKRYTPFFEFSTASVYSTKATYVCRCSWCTTKQQIFTKRKTNWLCKKQVYYGNYGYHKSVIGR